MTSLVYTVYCWCWWANRDGHVTLGINLLRQSRTIYVTRRTHPYKVFIIMQHSSVQLPVCGHYQENLNIPILCLIPRTTVTSLIASKNTRCMQDTSFMHQSRCSFFNTGENTQVAHAMTSVFLRNTRWRHGRSQSETKYIAGLVLDTRWWNINDVL